MVSAAEAAAAAAAGVLPDNHGSDEKVRSAVASGNVNGGAEAKMPPPSPSLPSTLMPPPPPGLIAGTGIMAPAKPPFPPSASSVHILRSPSRVPIGLPMSPAPVTAGAAASVAAITSKHVAPPATQHFKKPKNLPPPGVNGYGYGYGYGVGVGIAPKRPAVGVGVGIAPKRSAVPGIVGPGPGVGGGAAPSRPARVVNGNNHSTLSCVLCFRHFNRRLDLAHHLDSVHSNEQCLECGHATVGRHGMAGHLKHAHFGKPSSTDSVACPLCHKDVQQSTFLLKHLQDDHVVRTCAICPFQTTEREKLVHHIKQDHTHRKTVSCEKCGQVFTTTRHLQEHYTSEHHVYHCKTCHMPMVGAVKYREHLRTSHPLAERELNVTRNAQQLPPPPMASSALSSGVGQKPSSTKQRPAHGCSRCQYRSTQKSNLMRHFESFHLTFRCRICQEPVRGRKSIIEHVRKVHESDDDRYDARDAADDEELLEMYTLREGATNAAQASSSASNSAVVDNKDSSGSDSYSCRMCAFRTEQYALWLRHRCGEETLALGIGGASKGLKKNTVMLARPEDESESENESGEEMEVADEVEEDGPDEKEEAVFDENQRKQNVGHRKKKKDKHRPFKCPYCSRRSSTEPILARHIKKDHARTVKFSGDDSQSLSRFLKSGRSHPVCAAKRARSLEQRRLLARSSAPLSRPGHASNHGSDTESIVDDEELCAPAAEGGVTAAATAAVGAENGAETTSSVTNDEDQRYLTAVLQLEKNKLFADQHFETHAFTPGPFSKVLQDEQSWDRALFRVTGWSPMEGRSGVVVLPVQENVAKWEWMGLH